MDSFKAWTVAFSLVFIAIAALVRLFSPKFPKRFRARVVYVYDGDTICVRHRFRKLRIRLLGIDAPESEQEYGHESQQYLQSLVLHKKVEIRAIGVDIYGRYLGNVLYGDRDAGCDLLEAGLAWPYFRFFGCINRLAVARESPSTERLRFFSFLASCCHPFWLLFTAHSHRNLLKTQSKEISV